MATNKRTYPNDYFAWYNDDKRLAVVAVDTEVSSGERTKERYDSWQGTGNLSGNITATSTSAGAFVDMTSASHGLTVGDRVTISGTTTYDGNHAVTVVGDANTFRIAATNSTSNEGASSGVTWTSLFIDNCLRITYHAKYETITTSNFTDEFGSTVVVRPKSNDTHHPYVEINGSALHNAGNSVDFELHSSEESTLVARILQLAGITLKDNNLLQIGGAEEGKIIQQQKQ